MPELLKEMATDLYNTEGRLIREFVVLNSRGSISNSSKPRFVYYKEEHQDLQNKVDLLFEYGFLDDAAVKTHPIYRMTEEFVDLLKTMFPKN